MTQRWLGACQVSFGSRPWCLTTGFFSYSCHDLPPSVLNCRHSPRPVLVYAMTSGGFSAVPKPDVLALSRTALPEKAQSLPGLG